MKLKLSLLIIVMIFASCKNEKTPETAESIDYSKEELDITTSTYPEHITKVFDGHGGIDAWDKMKTLSFTMVNRKWNSFT